MLESYIEQLSLIARFFSFDMEQFQKRYQRRDSILSYFQTLFAILKQDKLFVLEPLFIDKVYQVSMTLAFVYPKDATIQGFRKKVFHEIHQQREKGLEDGEEKVEKILLHEREIRRIPESIEIERMHVLKMYEQDFQNYVNIYYQPLAEEKIDLFYYLATVNKFFRDFPESVLEVQMPIEFTITRLLHENWYPDEILAYAEETVKRFHLVKDMGTKVIEFSKKV